ncbi:MAG: hypothetical protein KQH67_10620 [Bacteroidetes bacterium]|nr:hypothetical protein [Bacteroidota bacterium]
MKKINLKILAFAFMAALFTFSGCKDCEDCATPTKAPTFTTLDISAESGNFVVTVGFSEGVYKNSNQTGNLDNSSFDVAIEGGSASLDTWTVTHTAGDNTAIFNIELATASNGSEIIVIKPSSDVSIYNTTADAMSGNQALISNLVSTITITDDGSGTGTTTWTSDNIYILDGFVFVNDGQILTIEKGTIIKGKAGQGENASALIVAMGGKIMAEGTAELPIIFTAEADDLQGSVPDLDNGLWGGVIILGKAKLNTSTVPQQIEGLPTTEPRGAYGGSNDDDDSGIFKYISIRHGGTDIGEGNEINGLTLGGVGRNTVIEYIEVFANKDDGVEFFGGVPRLNNIVVAFCGDDCYDYDQGYNGYGQFWLAVQGYGRGDRIGEQDGGTDPETGTPYATPNIYNATYMGLGEAAGKRLVTFRDNAGGHYANSIMMNQAKGIDIELLTGECSYSKFESGDLTLENNMFWDVTASTIFTISAADDVDSTTAANASSAVAAYFATAGNLVADPGITIDEGFSLFNPIPSNSVGGTMANTPDAWFQTVNYKGAFDPNGANWAAGWTLFSKYMN